MKFNSLTFSDGISSCLDVEAIDALIDIITKLRGNPAGERRGGFFSVFDYNTLGMATKAFGAIPTEKMSQYFFNSAEKATRLTRNNDSRSFQSRDEEKKLWGGGIRYSGKICAFSGFPEKLDEALSLIYAMYITHQHEWDSEQFRTRVMIEQVKSYNDNEFIEPVVNIFTEFYNNHSSKVAVQERTEL